MMSQSVHSCYCLTSDPIFLEHSKSSGIEIYRTSHNENLYKHHVVLTFNFLNCGWSSPMHFALCSFSLVWFSFTWEISDSRASIAWKKKKIFCFISISRIGSDNAIFNKTLKVYQYQSNNILTCVQLDICYPIYEFCLL